MQVASDIGWGQQNGEDRLAGFRGGALGLKEVFFFPVFGPARFNRTRVVGFGKVVGHECVYLKTIARGERQSAYGPRPSALWFEIELRDVWLLGRSFTCLGAHVAPPARSRHFG